jgi:hypothetical protein
MPLDTYAQDLALNWRWSQARSNLLFQNGHLTSVAEWVVVLFFAAEQLTQWRVAGSFFSARAQASCEAAECGPPQ